MKALLIALRVAVVVSSVHMLALAVAVFLKGNAR